MIIKIDFVFLNIPDSILFWISMVFYSTLETGIKLWDSWGQRLDHSFCFSVVTSKTWVGSWCSINVFCFSLRCHSFHFDKALLWGARTVEIGLVQRGNEKDFKILKALSFWIFKNSHCSQQKPNAQKTRMPAPLYSSVKSSLIKIMLEGRSHDLFNIKIRSGIN